MTDAPDPPPPLPSSLRALRAMVFALTGVMILGIVVLVGAFVIRLNQAPVAVPEVLQLPDGTVATAFTIGPDWVAVVTAADEILIFDRATGTLRQTVAITRP